MNLIKIILTFLLVAVSTLSRLFNVNIDIINIITIIISSLLIFCIANENSSKSNLINYIIIFLFWNITFSIIKLPELRNANLYKILFYTFSLKYVYLDLIAGLAIGSLISIIIKNKKIINILFEIILIILFYKLNNIIFLYSIIFLLSYLLKEKIKIKNPKNYIFSIISNLSVGVIVLHRIIITLILNLNIIKYNNIPDFIGMIILTYLLGLVFTFPIKTRPIIKYII